MPGSVASGTHCILNIRTMALYLKAKNGKTSHEISCVTDKIYKLIIIFINCNWVVIRWQWLFYMYTKYEIG